PVLVRDPSALVTALHSDVSEHAMPTRACFGIVRLAIRATTLDESEFAIGDEHVARRALRQESAIRAWFSAEPQRAALAALEQLAGLVRLPCDVSRAGCLALWIQRPRHPVFGQSVMEDGAAVIENDSIGLAVSRTQAASDHLAEQAHFFRRPRED